MKKFLILSSLIIGTLFMNLTRSLVLAESITSSSCYTFDSYDVKDGETEALI